jgi:hypothetical protein
MALNFPAPTPGATYTANGITYTYNGTLGAWTAAAGGSSSTFGLGLNLTGAIVKVSIPQQSTPPTAGPGASQAINGSLYWDDVLGAMFIRYINGGSPTWVQIVSGGGGGGGGGTVTSVTVAGSNGIVTTGNPIIGTGTITATISLGSLPPLP